MMTTTTTAMIMAVIRISKSNPTKGKQINNEHCWELGETERLPAPSVHRLFKGVGFFVPFLLIFVFIKSSV